MRQIDRNLGLDAAGTCAHDDDTAAEEDGFFDVMRYKQHGLLVAFPIPSSISCISARV